jgi:hypothetical protein
MKLFGFVLLVGLLTTACGSSTSSPVSPSSGPPPSQASMTGSWSGSSADSTGQESMTWAVTQAGTSVTGTMSFSDTGRGMMGNGSMTGTVNGGTVTFHMNVPTGGFSGAMSPCSMGMDGQATMSADGRTMTGTYSGNMSGMMAGGMMNGTQPCGAAMNNGQFTLTR